MYTFISSRINKFDTSLCLAVSDDLIVLHLLSMLSLKAVINFSFQPIFQRYPRPEKEYQSFSLIYNDRSLDLVRIAGSSQSFLLLFFCMVLYAGIISLLYILLSYA